MLNISYLTNILTVKKHKKTPDCSGAKKSENENQLLSFVSDGLHQPLFFLLAA